MGATVTKAPCVACDGRGSLRLFGMDANGPCEGVRMCHDCGGAGYIITQFRGKNALFIGVPFKDGKRELELWHRVHALLNIDTCCVTPGFPAHKYDGRFVMEPLFADKFAVIIVLDPRWLRSARKLNTWHPIPVLYAKMASSGAIRLEVDREA